MNHYLLDLKISTLFKTVKTASTLVVENRDPFSYRCLLVAFKELQTTVIEATFQKAPLISCAHALLEIADTYVNDATKAYYELTL